MRALLSPRMLGAHLLGLVCVCIAGGLGLWQYDAWERQRTAEAVDLTQVEPRPLADVLGPDQPFPSDQVGRPVVVSGTWLSGATVLVEGREHDDRDGYWVVTPLTSGGPDDAALAVVRGWVASPDDAPAAPTGTAEVVGWLQPPEGTGAVDTDPTDDVYPQLRVADLVQRVDGDLYGAYVVARDGLDGLPAADLEELPEASSSTGLRNLLYAIEWWVFGAFAAFIWWRFVQDSRAPAATDDRVASSV